MDRIVSVTLAPVGADREIVELPRLPVAPGAGVFRRLHPATLFKADDAHPGIGQTPGHRGAGCAGADDENVNFVQTFN